jgi:hypothetical protein
MLGQDGSGSPRLCELSENYFVLVRSQIGTAERRARVLTQISDLEDLPLRGGEDVLVDLVLLPESWDARLTLTRISAVLTRRSGAGGPAHLVLTCSGEVVPLPLGSAAEGVRAPDYELAFMAATFKSAG